MQKNTTSSYSYTSILLHWSIMLLVSALLILGFFMGNISAPGKYWWYNLHKSVGILILALMLARLYWRLINPSPQMPQQTPLLERLLAKSVHWLFYIALLAMPLSGWVMASASNHSPIFFLAVSMATTCP